MKNAQKADLLRKAMELLEDADVLVQQALGACDVCEETHNRIQDLVDDLRYDVQEFDNA
jgi:tRNA U54 and U55 pseudouridine synthase Pus10